MPDDLTDFQSRPGRKRQRVSVACRSCRTRKSRCDGNQPCSTCYDLGVQCRYEQPSQTGATVATTEPETPQSSLLDQRLQAIERKLDSLGSSERSAAASSFPSPQTLLSAERHRESPTSSSRISIDDLVSNSNDGVDGMAAVSLKDDGDEEEYFGQSSNVAFLRLIGHAVGRLSRAQEQTRRQITDGIAQSANQSSNTFLRSTGDIDDQRTHLRRVHVEPLVLPPRQEADSLLHLYFTTVNLMIPCIHEDTFTQVYQRMWKSGVERMSKPWLSSLNMIFALATNVMTPTSPPHERATASGMFYERAMELVKWDLFGRLSVEMVQVFLLAETYLEGTTSSSLVWTFHGMAIKGAYQLGLHCTTSAGLSEIDCEIRRRLWYWCVMNDRLLSVAYGRPPLVPLSHVRIESCSSIAFSIIPRGILSSSLAYYNALMSLTHIMGGAVDQLYGQNLGYPTQTSMSQTVHSISDLRWQLAQWQDKLPHFLKTITYDETLDSTPLFLETTRLRVLLSLRYLGTCILVLRPVLNQFLELSCVPTSHQSELLQSYGSVLLTDLVSRCRDTLELSKRILIASKQDKNLLGAWWFSCYYTFNSSLAVVGVLLIERTFVQVKNALSTSTTELRAMLDTAMEILHDLDGGSKTIMRCRDTLARLLAVVDCDGDAVGFAPSSFSLSPSSLWAWQGLDPGLIGLEAPLGLIPEPSQLQSESTIHFEESLGL